MWKIFVGFIAFAALALFVIMKGGDNIDMGGEKHGTEATESHAAPAASAASAAAPAASAASSAAPAASTAASK